MEFSTLGRASILCRASILFALLVSCGSNGTGGSTGTVSTPGDPGGPFVGPGSPGPFAAAAGATSDFTAKYGNGGQFESQGASGPFAKPGDCAAACARVASFVCPANDHQQQTPSGMPGGSASANSTPEDKCSQSCATLDAVQSDCVRNLIGPYLTCYLTAPLSCDRNGNVQAESCSQLTLEQLSQCGATVTQVPDQTGIDNGGAGSPGTRVDGGR